MLVTDVGDGHQNACSLPILYRDFLPNLIIRVMKTKNTDIIICLSSGDFVDQSGTILDDSPT